MYNVHAYSTSFGVKHGSHPDFIAAWVLINPLYTGSTSFTVHTSTIHARVLINPLRMCKTVKEVCYRSTHFTIHLYHPDMARTVWLI